MARTLLLIGLSLAPADAELLARAEEAFAEGVARREAPDQARPFFRAAAEHYEELRRRGCHNATLYRNQGNAYLLADDLPRAVLAYRRGLEASPGDWSLHQNLEFARSQVNPAPGGFGRPPAGELPPWLPRPSPTAWLAVAFVLFSAGTVLLTRWRMTRRGRLLTVGVAALTAGALPLAAALLEDAGARDAVRRPVAVVADDGVLVYKGNGTAYPRYEAPLNRGVEARLLFERGGWAQIELTGGEVGWVRREYLLPDGR